MDQRNIQGETKQIIIIINGREKQKNEFQLNDKSNSFDNRS